MRTRSLFLIAMATTASLPLFAGEASGEFTATKHDKIKPRYAVAYETRDQRDAHKRVIEVVLTEAPIDIAAAVTELDPHTQIINMDALRDHNYILLWVRPNNDVSMNATYSSTMTQFVDMTPGSLQANIDVLSANRVSGRLATTKAVKTMGDETYSIDVKFATDISHPPAGTKLTAGGGEPGKALKSLLTAMSKKNYAAIKAGVTPDRAESYSDVDDAVQTLGIFLPKNGKITGGELRGDTAIVEIEADSMLTLVKMVKSGATWQFDRATRAGFIDSK